MLVKAATSPWGWVLPAQLVIDAATESLLRWAEVDEADARHKDQASVRMDAIRKVRAAEAGNIESETRTATASDEVEMGRTTRRTADEIELVRSMVQHWPQEQSSTETASAAIISPHRPFGDTSASGSAAPSSSASRAPRRPRTSDEITSSASKKRSRVQAPASAAVLQLSSAGTRVLNMPELLNDIAAYLKFEKIDLVVLSQVSKRIRAIVLPMMVEAISVRLTKTDLLIKYFDNNPELINHVRCLRIWDEAAHFEANYDSALHMPVEHSLRQQRLPVATKKSWDALGALLLKVQGRTNQTAMPLLELSFGQLNLIDLYNQLRQVPLLLRALTALRIVGDYSSRRYQRIDRSVVESSYRDHGRQMSEDLEAILRIICDAQDDAGTDNFKLFHFSALALTEEQRDSVLPAIRPRTLKRVANRVQSLCLRLEEANEADQEAIEELFRNTSWPNLRRLKFLCSSYADGSYDTIQAACTRLLERHSHLEEVYVDIEEAANEETEPHWAEVTMLRLRSACLSLEHTEAETSIGFAQRHESLQELSVSGRNAGEAFPAHPNVMKSLRVLRCQRYPLHHFLLNDVNLAHLQVDVYRGLDKLCRYMTSTSHRRVLDNLTCIDIRFWGNTNQALHFVCCRLKWFPSLEEICVAFGDADAVEPSLDKSSASAEFLSEILDLLSRRASKLRALRIQYEGAAELPSDSELRSFIYIIPVQLEYLTWRTSFSNRTAHYRVVRPLRQVFADASISPPGLHSVRTEIIKSRAGISHAPSSQAGSFGCSSSKTSQNSANEPDTSVTKTAEQLRERHGELLVAARRIAAFDPNRPWLQRLPATFRPFVDKKTGVWEDMDDGQDAYTLFDHAGSEVRLKYA
ncbi:hypothetical protein OC835_002220 [Tilletia horrida]|nr:hypothetical protein OC835_002220 [Tilletia horrida]